SRRTLVRRQGMPGDYAGPVGYLTRIIESKYIDSVLPLRRQRRVSRVAEGPGPTMPQQPGRFPPSLRRADAQQVLIPAPYRGEMRSVVADPRLADHIHQLAP